MNRDVVDLERGGCGGRVQRSDTGSLSAKIEIDPVVRKSISNTLWISDCRKISNVTQKSPRVCQVSNLVSSLESGRSKTKKEKLLAQDVKKLSFAVSSTHLLRWSNAILKEGVLEELGSRGADTVSVAYIKQSPTAVRKGGCEFPLEWVLVFSVGEVVES
ncbi:hypothetical protein L6452_09544 [Arctium lappa]|uniref:Uncharacterized protein n=1 Tax=Arctium lappa TaxID=4217 RepID=A0ACB9DKA0_ARCLA|nr:hypothetical protein L6452_09544 [Arctium lappa]